MPEVMVTKVPDKKEDGEQPQKMTMARLMNLMPVICSNFSKVQIFPLSNLAHFQAPTPTRFIGRMHAIVSKEDKRRKSVSSVRETITEVSD